MRWTAKDSEKLAATALQNAMSLCVFVVLPYRMHITDFQLCPFDRLALIQNLFSKRSCFPIGIGANKRIKGDNLLSIRPVN